MKTTIIRGLLKRWLQRKGNQTVVMKKPEKMDKKMDKKVEKSLKKGGRRGRFL